MLTPMINIASGTTHTDSTYRIAPLSDTGPREFGYSSVEVGDAVVTNLLAR